MSPVASKPAYNSRNYQPMIYSSEVASKPKFHEGFNTSRTIMRPVTIPIRGD